MPGKATKLSNLIELDSEDDFARPDDDTMLTPDSAVENHAAKTRRRPAATVRAPSKVTKSRTTAKKPTATATARLKRSALLERNNLGNVSETDEVGDEDDGVRRARDDDDLETSRTAKRGKAVKSKADTIASKSRKTTKSSRAVEPESEPEEEEEAPRRSATSRATASKPSKSSKRAMSVEPTRSIPETQQDQTEITEVSMAVEEEPEDEPTPKPARKPVASRARSISRQRQPFRRAGSASDTERAGDPALRRKLGDITRQLENMQLKYNNLREIGMKDAESNFDKLRRTTEQRAKAQDEMIASLRKELALQKSLTSETKTLRAQVTSLTSENARLSNENAKLTRNVQEVQTESKNLTAKLAAARASSAPADVKQAPGSAVKRQEPKQSAPAALELATLKLKEELYGDLTGLILNGVKKLDGEDIYDCIQTGRNGTLHFHLSISSVSSNNSADYADAEFAYTPLLDEKNDRDLIDILPDYLTEEICFPRSSASRFYTKVVDCMTKKVVIEE